MPLLLLLLLCIAVAVYLLSHLQTPLSSGPRPPLGLYAQPK
jgi:hypothetical protein